MNGSRPFMRKQKFFLAVAVLFLLGFLCKAGLWSYEYYRLQAGFRQNDKPSSYDKHTDYLNRVPMEEMDFLQYVRYLNRPVNPVYIERETAFTAPFSLYYYQEEAGRKAVCLEIPADSVIEPEPEWSHGYPLGYGFESFPTYEKGWRWARPFTDGKDAAVDELPWRYVKTADLEAFAEEMARCSPHWQDAIQRLHASESELAYELVRKCDALFYEKGIYLSPDLYPVFWTWDGILLAAGFLAFSGCLLFSKIREFHSINKKHKS